MFREAFDNPDTRIEDCCMSKTSKGSEDFLINKYIAEMLQDLSKVTLQAHSKDHEDSWRLTSTALSRFLNLLLCPEKTLESKTSPHINATSRQEKNGTSS